MIFSVVAIVSLLSLLSFTGAAAVNARDGVCHTFTCPDADNLGEGLNPGSSNDGKVISCSYGTTAVVECKYDAVRVDPSVDLYLGSRWGLVHR